jgi:secreted PhoX family phosphatase
MQPRPSLDELLPLLATRRALLGQTARAALGLGLFPWLRPLGGALAPGLLAACRSAPTGDRASDAGGKGSRLAFEELRRGLREDQAVAPGHRAQVLLRWGDPLLPGAPAFDPFGQSADAQALQFGTANDFLAFLPLPAGSGNSQRGLLVVNHEHATPRLMFPPGTPAAQRADVMLASHGLSVVEIAQQDGEWRPVPGSAYNRRVTGRTPIELTGPAAGSPRLATSADPSGRRCLGTLGNCGGGVTPWGTYLSGEENVPEYFAGRIEDLPAEEQPGTRAMGLGPDGYGLSALEARFDARREPREQNRFGWIVELDPFDPSAAPKKRTALGRFRHEGATCVLAPDGRLVVYSGDDQKGECLYRFVSSRSVDARDPSANRDLLDEGVLSVARFDAEGRLDWLPLVHGEGPLTAANGFKDQADVLVEARRAARLLGGTPMDRPEDVKIDPASGCAFAVLTKNDARGSQPSELGAGSAADRANPRERNLHGHILELRPPGPDGSRDHSAPRFEYDLFLLCGDQQSGASFHPDTSPDGWFSCPDHLCFDPLGRLWVATDGNGSQRQDVDGLWAVEADPSSPERGFSKRFYAAPRGAELCGPCFTPDGRTLFVAVQHPAFEAGSNFEQPSTRWPDFDPQLPPRSAVVAIRREDGGPIACG